SMREIAVVLVLMLTVHTGAAWAQSAEPESTGEQIAWGTASVVSTALYMPLKGLLCVIGGGAPTPLFFSSGVKGMRATQGAACRGTWWITEDQLKGKTPINVVDDRLTPTVY